FDQMKAELAKLDKDPLDKDPLKQSE
ncbi:MAG: hypothetical protein FD167_6064, partial [bacterium]